MMTSDYSYKTMILRSDVYVVSVYKFFRKISLCLYLITRSVQLRVGLGSHKIQGILREKDVHETLEISRDSISKL